MKLIPYIIIAALLFISGFLFFRLRKSSAESDRKDTIIQEKESVARHWQTESGRNAMEKQAAIASEKEFRDSYPKFVDELKQEFNVKVKDLKAYVKAEFEVRGNGQGDISNTYLIDSAGRRYKEFNMDDKYLTFRTILFDSAIHAPYDYTYRDTLTYGFTVKKKWFLGKETLYGFGGLRNPEAKIIKSTNVLIEDFKDKRFSIGPYVGYGVMGQRLEFGVSLQYALIKF